MRDGRIAVVPSRGGGSYFRLSALHVGWKSASITLEWDDNTPALVLAPGGPHRVSGSRVSCPHAGAWREREVLPARIVYDGGQAVRITVPLDTTTAERVESWLGSAAVAGRVRVSGGWLIIPRELYEALRTRVARFSVHTGRQRLVVRASAVGTPPVPHPDGVALVLPTPCPNDGEYDATVMRGQRRNARLVVHASSGNGPVPAADLERVRASVGRVVNHTLGLSGTDREELVSDLTARAVERLQDRHDYVRWARGRAIDAVVRGGGPIPSRRERTSLDSLQEHVRDRPLQAIPPSTAVEMWDLLRRELTRDELRLVRCLAAGWGLTEASERLGMNPVEVERMLLRTRVVVARALDEAGEPPLRPSQRWCYDRHTDAPNPPTLAEMGDGTGQLALL